MNNQLEASKLMIHPLITLHWSSFA